MKIRPAVLELYQDNAPAYALLRGRVDDLFRRYCSSLRWHYESRVKQEQSFALKIETGRIDNPGQMEDFFACTLVVRNSTEIEQAVSWVLTQCTLEYRRPQDPAVAGRPASFEFDDLRLYVKLKQQEGLPPSEEFNRVFEVQIRTFLLHAWSIATHDLTYKSDDIDWGRARIAFQVRAMLEQAEVAIRSAEHLATFDVREDFETSEMKKIFAMLKQTWDHSLLPDDMKRLAENILRAAQILEIKPDQLITIVQEAARNEGPRLDLGPYQSIVNWLLAAKEEKFKKLIRSDRPRRKLVLYRDLSPPDWLTAATAKNILLI